jgi:hypothetical protein
LDLLISLWVDRSPFSKLVLPDRIRTWEDIDERNDFCIPSTLNDYSKLRGLKDFILKYISNLPDYLRIYEKEKNELSFEVLKLLLLML